jgi:hypothetical protein
MFFLLFFLSIEELLFPTFPLPAGPSTSCAARMTFWREFGMFEFLHLAPTFAGTKNHITFIQSTKCIVEQVRANFSRLFHE